MGMHNGRRSVETRVRAREEEKKTLLGYRRREHDTLEVHCAFTHAKKRGEI